MTGSSRRTPPEFAVPPLSPLGFAFYAAVLLAAFAVRSAVGFGAGLIAVPLLALILPVSTAVPLATVLTTFTSVHQAGRYWRHIAWHRFVVIFCYSMIGITLGLYFIKLLDDHVLRRCLGIFFLMYSIFALSAPNIPLLLPRRWHHALAAASGIAGGLISALFGAGAGPLYVVYFDLLRLERNAFRATMSAVVVLGGAVRIAGYGSDGLYRSSDLPLLAIGAPLVMVGSWLGDRLAARLDPRSFSRLVAAIILLSAITLIAK